MMVGPIRLLMHLWWCTHIASRHVVFWFAYISDLGSRSAFVWSIILVLLCQHDFSDALTCFSICSLRLCVCFFHCIIIEHIPECLVWWHSVPYLGYYFTLGHNPILRFIRCFANFSHCSFYFFTFVSCHTGAYPRPWVHRFSFADFLAAHFISWPLWVVILGHTPILQFIDVLQTFLITRSISWSLRVIILGHPPL